MKKPFAITLDEGTSGANHTGAWRTRRPEYVQHLAPCDHACAAGESPQAWLALAEAGDHRAAWELLVADNPLPAVMGRACYHPCEGACNRGRLDQAVSIHVVERFLGDLAIREQWPLPAPTSASTGKRILIVGGGPSGLSAAYQLVRRGHDVTLREAAPMLGGMMRYGIPRYRLPREILDAEIARIVALGVHVELGARVEDVARARSEERFDACFAAIGAQLASRIDIPRADAARYLDALALLHDVEEGTPPRLGRRVIVYGGGDTALDAARTVKRLGAEDALVVYRRSRATMPAHASEVREAIEEGVEMHWLRSIRAFDDGRAVIEKMELDEEGKARPTGELETLDADAIVLAIGQNVDVSPIAHAEGAKVIDRAVQVDGKMMTGHDGLFAGGDMVPGERSIAVAVGHGAKAARNIDAWLSHRTLASTAPKKLASFDAIHAWYYGDAPANVQPTLERHRRETTFDEVVGGLDEEHAVAEAKRCLSCGHCFECDNCFGMCPDDAIVKLGPGRGYLVDDDFCKGCGICVNECPCGAIELVAEGG